MKGELIILKRILTFFLILLICACAVSCAPSRVDDITTNDPAYDGADETNGQARDAGSALPVFDSEETETRGKDIPEPTQPIVSEHQEMTLEVARAIAEAYWKWDPNDPGDPPMSVDHLEGEDVLYQGVTYYHFRYRALIDKDTPYAHMSTWDEVYVNSVTGECNYDPPV